jgi:hypothetical protein
MPRAAMHKMREIFAPRRRISRQRNTRSFAGFI